MADGRGDALGFRISDREREEVIGQLRDHTSAGRLSLEEFDGRVAEVYAARTPAELRWVLRELPLPPAEDDIHRRYMGDRRWRDVLDRFEAALAGCVSRAGGRAVKTTGDGGLAVIPVPADALTAADGVRREVATLGLDVRAGVHTGEIELRGEDVAGIAVHIGQRISALAAPGEILVSRTVVDLVTGSGLRFADRGEHELKGLPGTWTLSAVT